jgi:hypothetical protein
MQLSNSKNVSRKKGMTTQLLIYETAVPVSAQRHADSYVEGGGYGFSRNVNAVPLMAVEFPQAASEYAIVFAGDEEAVMPSVILGMRGQQNAFLNDADEWGAKYVPAFIRRYPFVFSSTEDGQTMTLCIDEAFAGFNRDGKGQALFGEDGKPTPYVDNVLKFLQEYQAQFQRTRTFCNKLRELELLEPMQATMSLQSGERLSLTGFLAINRDKLKALPAEKIAELIKTDELELVYLHLQSMRNFSGVQERLASMTEAAPAAEGEEADNEVAETAEADA